MKRRKLLAWLGALPGVAVAARLPAEKPAPLRIRSLELDLESTRNITEQKPGGFTPEQLRHAGKRCFDYYNGQEGLLK